jgi:tetratricopeptide (TPR) repeat protein
VSTIRTITVRPGLRREAFPLLLCLALAAWAWLSACPCAGAGADVPPAFREGFEAYAAGAYDVAAKHFRDLAAQVPAAGTYHNLGNAEWKKGQVGEAILAWEKAQWLDPYGANTRANLRFARQKAQLPSPALAWYEICSTWLPSVVWATVASACLWLSVTLVLLPGILRWRKADWHHALSAACLAVFLLTLPALVGVSTRSRLGVVRAPDTPLRLTPTHEAQVLAKLPAGELARVENVRGDYVYVRTGSDAAGWVHKAQFGLLTQP